MIKIYRQYPVINGFLQVPPNLESDRTKYIVGNQVNDPVGTLYDSSDISDQNSIKVVTIKRNTEYLEFLAATIG
jgi:hypothetical protein